MENARTPPRFTAPDARRLLRAARSATLSTLMNDGSPYGSLVNVATDQRGRPLLLISKLAWHTRNLEADGRASILAVGAGNYADPVEGPRVTLIGRMAPVSDAEARARFLAKHPQASLYAGFKDFAWWRMEVEQAHAVAGFGRIETYGADEILLSEADARPIAEIETGAVEHMNEDHADAVRLYATKLLGAPEATWRMTACDADGVDMTDGEQFLRLDFDSPVRDGSGLRVKLVELAKLARGKV